MSLHIAPEIETRVREVAAARGVSVDVVLDEALQLLQRRSSPPVVRRVADDVDKSREYAWVARPDLLYVNEWIVLEGDKVVAHGADAKSVYSDARARGISSPFMHFVNEPDPVPLWIGWQGTE